MSLTTYRAKRRFSETPEPRGSRQRQAGVLRFAVQKHQASHLHYDFRLELDGVLKSWAVPKGPSLDPADKRLAMMVEDHPLDYRAFEGTIPSGNYGAGTVLLWDEGTYRPTPAADSKNPESRMRAGLKEGRLTFVLHGQKLQGEFSMVKLRRGRGNEWLLIKKRDAWAAEVDVTQQDRSVASGRSLAEIAAGRPAKRGPGKAAGKTAAKAKPAKRAIRSSEKDPMPHHVKPMLATLVDKPFDREGWLFEVKWDGYRAIAEVGRRGVSFYSRNHKSFEHRFAPLLETLRGLGHEAVLDGEVVAVDQEGRSRFQLLQNYQKTGEGRLLYYVFDLLYLDGRDLRGVPLRDRKHRLGELLANLPNVRLSEHVEGRGIAFFNAAVAQGLEGVVAKDGESTYREGFRGGDWLKIKTRQRQEAVICGYTEPRGSRQHLGALILGVYDGKELVYVGHTGGGFDAQGLADVRSKLAPLRRKSCPFRKKPPTNAAAHWVAPKLVCEVAFQEWTDDGIMRQPIFVGLREDKAAHGVHREKPKPASASAAGTDGVKRKTGGRSMARRERIKSAVPEHKGAASSGHPALTNLDKLYWPEEGITKGDLIAYYREVAPVLLPYLHDRPQSLHRHPNGVGGKSFFQKDVSRQPPPAWVQTVDIPSESVGKELKYLLCQDEAALLYLVNLGCIELNPWNSRVGSLDRPDYLVIDLDPEDIPFARVIEAALAVRRTLEDAGAECLCKTSGKRGLHLFVPLGARYDDEPARRFAEIVANLVNGQLPRTTSIVRSPAQRQHRVYLDFLQNRRGQTLAAPYSARPFAGATVSTPLQWQEVKKGLDPARFTIHTLPRRIAKVGDLWTPVLGKGIDLEDCLARLAGG